MNNSNDSLPMASVKAWFCGHILWDKPVKALKKLGWTEQMLRTYPESVPASRRVESEDYELMTNVFYPSFIDSMANHTDLGGKEVKLCRGYRGKHHLSRHPAVREIECGDDARVRVAVELIHLFIMPDGTCLWAVETDYSAPPEQVCAVQSMLRSFGQPFMPVLEELLNLTPDGRIDQLQLSGSKAKVFQRIDNADDSPERIFEFGCMLPYGSMTPGASTSGMARSYYDRIIGANLVTIWADWSALALVDSFTILGKHASVWDENFYCYFRFIYLNSLYQKVSLQKISRAYRSGDNRYHLAQRLRETLDTNHWYGFTQISHNFMPQLIYNAIDKGMEVSLERKELAARVAESTAAREKQSDRNTNTLLTLVAIFSVMSVLFDLSQYRSQYWNLDTEVSKWATIAVFPSLLIIWLLLRLIRRFRQ